MTFLAPLFLAAGLVAAAAVVLLHFLARRRPKPAILPTARFVPDDPARWPARAPRPTDWLLLALRVLALLAVAAGFAQPVRERERLTTARIVLVDRSRAIGDERAMRDSTLSVMRESDVLIAFDTSSIALMPASRDSVAALTRSAAVPSLSVAFIAAERAALDLRERADSLELVIVSSFADAAWDAATPELRARWPGRVRVVPVPLARGDTASPRISLRGAPGDPVGAAIASLTSEDQVTARVVRGAPGGSDSAWARGGPRVLISWPAQPGDTALSPHAVLAGDVVLAAPLARRTLGRRESELVIARFADGSPAVVEHAYGEGCIRDVGFDFPHAGDVPLRESSRRLASLIVGRCQQQAGFAAMLPARLDSLRGHGGLVATSMLPRVARQSSATAWLLILAALFLLSEVAVRRRATSS